MGQEETRVLENDLEKSDIAFPYDALTLVSIIQSLALGIVLSPLFLDVDLPAERLADEAATILLTAFGRSTRNQL